MIVSCRPNISHIPWHRCTSPWTGSACHWSTRRCRGMARPQPCTIDPDTRAGVPTGGSRCTPQQHALTLSAQILHRMSQLPCATQSKGNGVRRRRGEEGKRRHACSEKHSIKRTNLPRRHTAAHRLCPRPRAQQRVAGTTLVCNTHQGLTTHSSCTWL